MTDVGSLLDLSGNQGNLSNVISRNLNLILDTGGAHVLNTLEQLDTTDKLLSQEITNLNVTSSQSDIDRKMGIDETHLVKESLGNSDKHVVNVGAYGTDTRKLLTGGEPQVDADKGLLFAGFLISVLNEREVHAKMLEVTRQGTTRASDIDDTGLDSHLNCKSQRGTMNEC